MRKKKHFSIIGSPWAKELKKGTLMRAANIFAAFWILYSNAIVRRSTYAPNGTREKKETRGKRNEKEERSAVASPTRNRTLPNGEEEGRSRTRERNHTRADGHPRRPPALATTCCYTKSRIRRFAICRPTSMRDTVRYDMTWDETGDGAEGRLYPLFETTRRDRRRLWYPEYSKMRYVSRLLWRYLRRNIPINSHLIVICLLIKYQSCKIGWAKRW